MSRETIHVSLDMATTAFAKGALVTPRPDDQIMRINSIEYDISVNPGATSVPQNVYAGIAPKTINDTVTEVTNFVISDDMPHNTLFDQLIEQSLDNGATLEWSMNRSGVITPDSDIYALSPEVFLGTISSEVGVGNLHIFCMFSVDFDFVKLTQPIATGLALTC